MSLIGHAIKFSKASENPIMKIYHTITYLYTELMKDNSTNSMNLPIAAE